MNYGINDGHIMLDNDYRSNYGNLDAHLNRRELGLSRSCVIQKSCWAKYGHLVQLGDLCIEWISELIWMFGELMQSLKLLL